MNDARPHLPLESTRIFAHSAIVPAIASVAKSPVNPISCAISAHSRIVRASDLAFMLLRRLAMKYRE